MSGQYLNEIWMLNKIDRIFIESLYPRNEYPQNFAFQSTAQDDHAIVNKKTYIS